MFTNAGLLVFSINLNPFVFQLVSLEHIFSG